MTQSTTFAAPVPQDAKWAFTTRRVERRDAARLLADVGRARSGDLVLGQIASIGQHRRVQLASARFCELYTGDHVVVACGDRYAPDQFEGIAELDADGADLLAGGGILGRMREANARMSRPTRVRALGLLADASGAALNVERYRVEATTRANPVPVIGVVGSSMNAGKTTAVASLGHGLARAGLTVAAIKATGTGSFGDVNAYRDAGIAVVTDFTDAGMASTYRQPLERIEQGYRTLLDHAAGCGADVVLVELADGIYQAETAALLRRPAIRGTLDGVMFAARDAAGTVAGLAGLREIGIEPFAVTGMVSSSPLAMAEASQFVGTPVISREALRDANQVTALVGAVTDLRRATALEQAA